MLVVMLTLNDVAHLFISNCFPDLVTSRYFTSQNISTSNLGVGSPLYSNTSYHVVVEFSHLIGQSALTFYNISSDVSSGKSV